MLNSFSFRVTSLIYFSFFISKWYHPVPWAKKPGNCPTLLLLGHSHKSVFNSMDSIFLILLKSDPPLHSHFYYCLSSGHDYSNSFQTLIYFPTVSGTFPLDRANFLKYKSDNIIFLHKTLQIIPRAFRVKSKFLGIAYKVLQFDPTTLSTPLPQALLEFQYMELVMVFHMSKSPCPCTCSPLCLEIPFPDSPYT